MLLDIFSFLAGVTVQVIIIMLVFTLFRSFVSGSKFSGRIIRNTQCPECRSKNYIPIIYGYSSEELLRKGRAGEAKLGGCCVGIGDPDSYCKDCGYSWENW
jgi:hypothetical protein